MSVYEQYGPMLKLLDDSAREKLLKGNYTRIFDAGRLKVRAWEQKNLNRR